jgi:D-glycero-alpha-D-manno-heptose-7-phosphate kinase
MVVAMLAAYRELLSLPLGEYDLAHLAYEIERIDCGLAGGKQDQYATTFGGFNFMEFFDNNRVVVNPLRIRRHIENELQAQMLMYFTGQSRESALIINDQIRSAHNTDTNSQTALLAMHEMKNLSFKMKEMLLRGNISAMANLLRESWNAKKQTADAISNNAIESIAETALDAGANAVKISGAGGGGFMMLFVDPVKQLDVIRALEGADGSFHKFQFTHNGAEAWSVG